MGHGSDVLRVPGSQAKFLPQGADEVDDAARAVGPVLAPHPGIEIIFREHDTRIAGKEVEQPVLRRGQVYVPAPHGDSPPQRVDHQVPMDDERRRPLVSVPGPGPGAPEQRFYACGALCGVIFRQAQVEAAAVVVGAGLGGGDGIEEQQSVPGMAQVQEEGAERDGPLDGGMERDHIEGMDQHLADGVLG